MKIKHECIPCLIRQSVEVAQMITDNDEIQKKIIKNAAKIVSEATFDETAVYLAMKIHKYAKEITNVNDPYKNLKVEYNTIAEDLIIEKKLEEMIANSDFPFEKACRLAIAGNIIDFGLGMDLDKDKVNKSLEESLNSEIVGESIDEFYNKLLKADNIMIITDNAGEIVFDKLLVKELALDKITYVVKGGPIVNDATMEDAVEVGMTELVRVIDNGLEAQGTIIELCSDEFKDEFDRSDIIISKGQANYETLSHLEDSRIYFLLKAKCKSVADDLACKQDDFVIKNFDLSS